MHLKDYPKLTTIMRGYSYREAMAVIKTLSKFDHQVAVEVTTNNPGYLKIIHDGNQEYGDQVDIGAGTVLTAEQAEKVIDQGAQFMLGPVKFTSEIFRIAKEHTVLTIPATMSPTGVYELFQLGASIVKIFPAVTVGPTFFRQIQGPLGRLPLMAVGGINQENAKRFIDSGAKYLGVGSAMFNSADVHNLNESGLSHSIQQYLDLLES